MPYFALRSYSDGGEHYDGQIGSEATPTAFLEALWAVTAECWRVLKPSGSLFVNLGDKYAGSGGHNNAGIAKPHTGSIAFAGQARNAASRPATRRSSPDRYNQASDGIRAKSLMGLPWRFAIGCIDGQADPEGKGWILRSEIVWSKPNGLPESVTDRVRRSHEQWFHLTKNGTYWADVDPLRDASADQSWVGRTAQERVNSDRNDGGKVCTSANPLGALPRSVWTVATQPLVVPADLGDHFAAFPTEWPRRLITGWCPPDGIVLDPFGGTGTTAMVARALGRYGISIDLSADYLRLADWRIWESGQDAKVARRTAEQATDPTAAEAAFTAAARLADPAQLDIFADPGRLTGTYGEQP